MRDSIFKYEMDDAWHRPISGVEVFETEKGGIIETFYSDDLMLINTDTFLIDIAAIIKLKEIINKHEDVIEIKSVEINGVLDGVINRFIFNIDGKTNEIVAYNIWCVKKKNKGDYYGSYPVNAMKVIKLFDSIARLLKKAGVEQKFLRLNA